MEFDLLTSLNNTLTFQLIIYLGLASAKIEVAHHWKSAVTPSIVKWFDRVWLFFVLYKITDGVLLRTTPNYKSVLVSTWFSVITFFKEHHIIAPTSLPEDLLSFH